MIYRYKHFTTSLLLRDLRFAKDAVRPGDPLPAFEWVTTNGDRLVNRDVFGGKPVLLIFGSMTCPMTASAAPSIQKLYEKFGDQVEFVMLYVREAHPGEHFPQSETMEQKLVHARAFKELYDIRWKVAADGIDGDLHRTLDPKPNSAFLINSDGVILFRSLWAADTVALHQALDDAVAGRVLQRQQSLALIGPVSRAMGKVHEVMKRGGPQAVRDLWRAGFPIALAGRIATFFSPLSPDRRGIAAVLTITVGMLAGLYIFVSWILA